MIKIRKINNQRLKTNDWVKSNMLNIKSFKLNLKIKVFISKIHI